MIKQTTVVVKLYDSEYISIGLIEETDTLLLLWNCPVTSAQYRESYLTALEYVKEYECKQWLIDIRLRGLPTFEDETWRFTTFNKNLRHESQSKIYIAIFLTEEQYNEHIGQYNLLLKRENSDNININYFTRMQEIYEWLQDAKDFASGKVLP